LQDGAAITYLRTREAAERLRVAASTLANWRSQGRGPRYARLGGVIVYPAAELDAFVEANLRNSTSDDLAGSRS
jgi:predicted DNA-binding transcriptional regulator AlpA